jgi:hypothetical protein
MDIKLVKNFEDGIYIPVNEQLLLQILNHNYRLGTFEGKEMFMLNPVTNERFEVCPELHKFALAKISYACAAHDYIYFTSAKSINESQIEVLIYRYDIVGGEAYIVHSICVELEKLGTNFQIKVFALDDNYCIIETVEYEKENLTSTGLLGSGRGKHTLILKEITERKELLLKDTALLSKSGIEQLLPITGNICAIKIGSPLLEEMMFTGQGAGEHEQKEIVGIINVKQFISELLLNQDNEFLEILDEGTDDVTFPYIRQYDSEIVYSKVDVSKKIEEVIIYDYESKVKKVRLNTNITKVSDLNHTYMINDTPYIIKNTDKSTRLINLNTQRPEIRFSGDVRIKFIRKDFIVVQRHIKKMFFMRKENYNIEVFRYPDMHHPIFTTRAKYKDCIAFYDDLLIFTS